jgi:structural maintenance of chromosome 4
MPPRKAPAAKVAPTSRTKPATAKGKDTRSVSSSSSTTRPARRAAAAAPKGRRQISDSDEDEEEESDEDEGQQRSSAADSDDEMGLSSGEEEEEEVVKKPRATARKPAAVPASKRAGAIPQPRRSTKQVVKSESEEEEDDEASENDEPVAKAEVQRKSKQSTPQAVPSSQGKRRQSPLLNTADETTDTIGAETVDGADASSSIDADATFIAPSRPDVQDSLPAHASRYSMSSAQPGSVPSTPVSKPGGTNLPSTPAAPASQQPTSRLVIHKLVLKDFKSYAGLQTIGPFHKSFSSVVGPNGSGKSNVIDALLFVFGWRANKMRQGKLGELIHSPAMANQTKPSDTKVSVVFREIVDLPGPDAYKVVPKSKLVVSRTAYQNNSSVYHVNGKKSSFTEVTTLLKGRGIDLDHKRFLILQGEVESIAQMPPKARTEHEEGLLEYLEDIIGTSRFKEEIEEAIKVVDACNEQRGERLGRLKIVQREKDAMEGKKREAESLLRDHNALAHRQSVLWQIYMYESRMHIEQAQTSMASLSEKITTEREKHKDAQANIAELEANYATSKKEWDALKAEVGKLAKEVEKLEKEDLQVGEKKKHFETKKKKVAKALNDDKHHLSEARTTMTSSAEEIERLQSELAKLEASLEAEESSLESIRDSLKGKTGHLSQQIEAKQRELAPWMDKVKEKEGTRDVKAQEVELIKGREEAREQELQDSRQQRQQVKEDLKAKQEELKSLAAEKEEVEGKTEDMLESLKGLKSQEAKLRAKASAARAKSEEAKSTQQASASQSTVLAALSRQAELGMIKGFHGRLGSLGVIDDKYDIAISTACPGLDNIVVETVENGQACIEHLRRNNVGRANFIILASVSNLSVQPIQTPENVPRLVDLVKPRDARYMPAFYHSLRDTLVARDLDQAKRVAYGATRYRVVTLDGQLIDKSGTMSGGGSRPSRGGMSSKFADAEYSPEQVARLQQEVVQLEGELQALTMKVQRYEVELRDMQDRPGQIDIEMEKAQMALKVGAKTLEEASKRVEDLKSQSQPDAAEASRLAQLESELQALEGEITKLRSKTSVYESDIAGLQEKILDAGGVKLRAQQSKVDGIKEMIELSNEKSTKAEVAKAKAEKDTTKLEAAIKKHEAALAEVEEEMDSLKSSSSEKGSVVSKARAKLEERQAAFEEKQEERDELKSSLDESSGLINAFRSLEVEIKQKMEDNQRSLVDNEKKLKHWEEKHQGLELHQIDSDEDEEEDEENEEDEEKAKKAEGEDAADQSNAAEEADGDEEVSKKKSGKRSKKSEDDELVIYDDEDLSTMDRDTIKAEIAEYEEKVQKGSGNFAILAEYRKREQEYLSRWKDLEQVTQERDAAKNRHDELRKRRLDEFMTGFSIISSKLKEMYQTITLGGNAELETVDSLDPFSEGVLFSVMPPKKSWKNISNLSGGEKTLASLALVFALHVYKPTPLYVMDEIDAALDFRNVSIVANLIKERTKNAQFVIISLRNNMFELSSRLVGIYKTNGQTKSLAVENTELSEAVAEEAAIVSAALAASARKARTNPAPPRTPSAAGPLSQRYQQSVARVGSQSQLSVTMKNAYGEGAVPSTPLSKGPQMRGLVGAAGRTNHGLPETPLVIPQTPRVPKSLLARTPKIVPATPRIPSGERRTVL